jgi:hypothetical protein
MKKIYLSVIMACFALIASAQISEGVPSAKKYGTGNRPLKGAFGLYIGGESNLFKSLDDDPFSGFHFLPIVNLKYMVTDNLEARVGLKFWKERETLKFGNDEGEDPKSGAEFVNEEYSAKAVRADNQIRPGIAYHFTKSNLLDVYAGFEAMIGWQRTVQNTWRTIDGEETTLNRSNSSVQLGAGAFIGLQAFIARLPLAIGLEYGISTTWDGGLKQRTYYKSGDTEYTVYSQDNSQFKLDPATDGVGLNNYATNVGGQRGDGTFDWMKARKGRWGSMIRVTLSYYFNR